MISALSPWHLPVTLASGDVRSFMLRYRPSQEQDERAITAHLVHLMHRFQKRRAGYPGLELTYEARLADAGQRGEAYHGADFEVWLRGGGLALGLRLQAKRLFPAKTHDGSYESLGHVVKGTGARQVALLMGRTPPGMNPGYIFYNTFETAPAAATACCLGGPSDLGSLGLTVARAAAINAVLPALRAADVMPVSVPAQCAVACPRSMPRRPSWRAVYQAREPDSLPLGAAAALLSASRRTPSAPAISVLRDPRVALSPTAERALSFFRPGAVELGDGRVPEYVDALEQEGSTGMGDDDRPAQVVAVLRAGPADDGTA